MRTSEIPSPARIALALITTLAVLIAWNPLASAQSDPPRVAVLADSGNFPDALAASAVAAQFGGIVLLTRSSRLETDAAIGLERYGPDVVILAGGEAALSAQVEADVTNLGYTARRVAGEVRTETARELAALLDDPDLEQAFLHVNGTAQRALAADDADTVGGLPPQDLQRLIFTGDDEALTWGETQAGGTDPVLFTEFSTTRTSTVVADLEVTLANSTGSDEAVSCEPHVRVDGTTFIVPDLEPSWIWVDNDTRGICSVRHVFEVPAGEHYAYASLQAGHSDIELRRRTLTLTILPFPAEGAQAPPD